MGLVLVTGVVTVVLIVIVVVVVIVVVIVFVVISDCRFTQCEITSGLNRENRVKLTKTTKPKLYN